MEWQQIVGFHQVAQKASFTRAAEATFRTQSALSQQVKALEGELGCRLMRGSASANCASPRPGRGSSGSPSPS